MHDLVADAGADRQVALGAQARRQAQPQRHIEARLLETIVHAATE
jgi:hypothetical protein